MSNITGMDIDAVEQLGQDLFHQADMIQQTMAALDRLVEHSQAIWKGQDATQFADWWRSQHRPAMQQAHDAIHGLGQSAKNNAGEQRQASGH